MKKCETKLFVQSCLLIWLIKFNVPLRYGQIEMYPGFQIWGSPGQLIENFGRPLQNQNFTYFAIGFSVILLMINKPMLEIRLESVQKNLTSTKMVNYHLQINSVDDCLTLKQHN